MSSGIHVLCVDDPDVRSTTAAALERADAEFEVTTADSVRDALSLLADDSIECIVSGHDVPGLDGLAFLETVRDRDPELPFILCPRNGSEAVASEAISHGVTDYVRTESGSDRDDRLASRIETAVERYRSRRRAADRDLEWYQTLVQRAPIKLFAIDEDATIVWLNDEYAEGFAESREELIGTPFPTLIERGYYREEAVSRYLDEVRTLLSSRNDVERGTYEVRFYPTEGDERIYDVHIRLLPLEDGEFAGTIHALRDVTQRHRYRTQLERQNERLEEFTSVVSHDLRNPLNVAQGRLKGHADRCSLEDDSLDRIRWALDRMDTLIDDLLSLARHGQVVDDLEPVSLSRLVSDAWDAVDTVDATLECSAGRTIYADASRVQELFENLFRNAVEHGRPDRDSQRRRNAVERGSARSELRDRQQAVDDEPTEDDDASPITVTVGLVEEDGSTTGFYVADDGPGLPADDEIFEFGYTTAADGTGFGLGIVEQIADAHGWTVTACNGEDGGARFEFRNVTVFESA